MLALVSIALKRPYTFVVMAMLIVIFGVLSWVRTPVDIFPAIRIPVVAVVWSYNGLPPEDMSGRVIYYYERTLSSQVNDIEHIESQSLAGYGVVKVFFQPTVNINAALAQITAASQTVLKLLPPGITPPYVLSFNASSVPVIQLALSSSSLPQSKIFDFGQNLIRPQLATVAGAAVPSPYGGKVRQVQIDVDQAKLRAYGLSPDDVVRAVGNQDLIIPVGTQKIGDKEYVVHLNDSPKTVPELNQLPIRTVDGATVRVGDVAYAHDSFPPQINMVRVDGSNAVLMTILKAGSASTLDVINGVKALLPRVREMLPAALKLVAVGDQSPFVENAVHSVIFEGVLAAALTGLMILIFLGSWRSTVIIIISIPLAILTSVTLLAATGENINVMTLGGLALAVGILVDDATVTIENINFQLEQKKEIEAAIMDGARQIVIPATVSLLCICIVFVPMFSLGGISGYLFRPMAKAVIFALMGSYLLSRTLVPTMANYLLAGHAHDPDAPARTIFGRFQHGFERRFAATRRGYEGVLVAAMRRRKIFIAGFLGFVAVSLALVPTLGQNFFPAVETVQMKLHVRGPTGLRIEETGRLFSRVESAIKEIVGPGVISSMVDNIGLPISGINMAYSNSGTIGSADGDILITLEDGKEKDSGKLVRKLRENLPELFPEATFSFLPADIVTQILNFGLPAPIDVQVIGNNQVANRALANRLLKRIAQVPGVADARIQQPADQPTINVDVNRILANRLGVSEKDIATSMLITLAGSIQTSPVFWLNPKNGVSYPVVVQTPQYWMKSLQDLARIPVSLGKSPQILGAVADIGRKETDAVVSHYNVQPVIDIFASNTGRDLGAVSADVIKILDEFQSQRPRGTQIVLRGQTATMNSAYAQLYEGLALAVVLIYLLIVVNFQSWTDPFVIVSALPAALAGVAWMLFATHTTLSVPALTGAIMTMGVATANSILVVSFAREQLAEGLEPFEAALNAGVGRFRPVLMTALAMIIGMGPMALSAEQNAPLGRAVIGGLIFATVATLIFVPVVFGMAHSRKSRPSNEASHEK
ncbi:efflux RND transporter permease subunit [Rhodoblastus acidophilus]|uniref:Efflux RND transporter permease subunit n=1 Tax=Candidatus Rhodoblastus alkanivorans TaxID=2954117 RepID=A0ABS9ZAX6_9HYPH|nr:efflux RND transporter permease subunit [Candidatus Rhodoblastus alkanivorans]MCI4679392.1 efflux RND transporter permease subunit [Candidatus Rhodoblastus alkanivorans]MCI4684868.1 efflux RND transporter permease subunit [Candidatus Rhodoblastus alkanivorans]MDI4642192.1 efflux RND transporter permease subunit [Rhodoblastus acidophilus]